MPSKKVPIKSLRGEVIAARERKQYTQADVERLSDGRISQQNLSAIESGRVRRPKIETLDALAEVLELDALDLKILAGVLSQEEAQKLKSDTPDIKKLQRRLSILQDQLSRIPEHYFADVLEALSWLPSLSETSQARVVRAFKDLVEKEKTNY